MRLGTPNPATVAKYRRALPAHECAALDAWLSQFYPFQLDWLLEQSGYAVCNKARQIGLSHTGSAIGVLWGAFHGELTTIISVGDRESAEVLDKARKHASILTRLGSRMAQTGKRDNATELSFASGGRIIALPSTGGRSFTGNVFLDEYAYQQHSAKVWDAAGAVTMLGDFRLRVISTPNGVGNEFHGLWKKAADPEFGWRRHEIPIETAQAQGYPVDIKKCWTLAKGDQRLFAQLFQCRFLDAEAQYIPSAAIDDCTTPAPTGPCEANAFAGLDIGRTADLTALYVIRKGVDGRWRISHHETCKRTSQPDIDRMVDAAFAKYQLRRLCIDSSGLGAFPAEQIQRRHGRSRVEPVVFTLQVKEDLATVLYSTIVGDLIRLPRSDAQLTEDLCSLRRIITPAGNIRYDAPHTDEGHADRAWALALALHAAGQQPISPARDHGMT